MKFELFPFQRRARKKLRKCVYRAQQDYATDEELQVISFTAPTGSGKTIMLASFVESVYIGDEDYPAQSNAIFVWLSDSPELNKQSLDKFWFNSDIVDHSQLIMIEDESFNQRILDDGKIYFLNTQKLGKSSNLTKHSDSRQFTIWETLQSTIREKADRLYFIIDEAHRGMRGTAAGRATTIMQKFLKGSEEDGLSPAPLIIGMSATSERFNALARGITTTQTVKVEIEEVKASGLLKDRIIVVHPDETTSSSITKEMAMLEAATDEWKNKCEHWAQYCREQHKKLFNPIFVIQVMNGTGDRISDTDLDECLKRISMRTGLNFEVGEVAHTFQTNTDLTINNLRVIYREPSQIAGDDKIKVVFFKENLSTGWDCPQAETMMSFRRARDATYIAQLLGRMIRTPMQSHIEVDDTLNDVRLYLPYFDKETVQDIVTELQSAEGGTIPADIISESTGERVVVTWGVEPKRTSTTASNQSNSTSQNIIKPPETKQIKSVEEKQFTLKTENITRSIQTEDIISDSVVSSEENLELTGEVSAKEEFVEVVEPEINRKEIVKAVNDMGLLTYKIRTVRNNDYFKSLLSMAHFLTQSFIYHQSVEVITGEICDLIHSYIEDLKNSNKYDELKRKVKEFKLSAQIFDVFGKTVESRIGQNMFVTTDTDLDRQFSIAEAKLKSDGIANAYLGKFCVDYDFIDDYKIDVILFVANMNCMANLEKYSKKRFHELNDEYRRRIAKSSARTKREYDRIVSDGDKISEHNFTLPETISLTTYGDGKEYSNHLFVDDYTGKAKIKLNGWEEGVLREEEQRTDFVCWLRNVQKASWSLCIPYHKEDDSIHEMYPDFLIVRRDEYGYIVDILEPHDPNRRDNIGKARGFAEYAKKNNDVGRLQLIRKIREGEFKRLDMSRSEIQDRVCRASTNNELDSIFDDYGQIESSV